MFAKKTDKGPKHSFAQFNFLVEFTNGKTNQIAGGFQECSGLSSEKPSGSITLKRGAITNSAFERLQSLEATPRSFTIRLQKEDRSGVEISLRLINARVTGSRGGPQRPSGTDVAMEEMIVAYERLDFDE